MSSPFDNLLGLSATALPLREARMQQIASNLANADTPGYKARDVEFSDALAQAAGAPASMHVTDAHHMTPGGLAAEPRIVERASTQPSLDGNTVDAETEHAAYGRAALEYRASLTFLESRVRGLLTAITGQ